MTPQVRWFFLLLLILFPDVLRAQGVGLDRRTADLAIRAVQEDALAWAINRLDSGTSHIVGSSRSTDGSLIVRIDYKFNNGRNGFVDVKFTQGRVECLTYWDLGFCQPPRSAHTVMIDRIKQSIITDSELWAFNRLDMNSINFRSSSTSPDGSLSVRMSYTFNYGRPGSVIVRVIGDRVDCLNYEDVGVCLPPRVTPRGCDGTGYCTNCDPATWRRDGRCVRRQ
jgi:hypothetical protein